MGRALRRFSPTYTLRVVDAAVRIVVVVIAAVNFGVPIVSGSIIARNEHCGNVSALHRSFSLGRSMRLRFCHSGGDRH